MYKGTGYYRPEVLVDHDHECDKFGIEYGHLVWAEDYYLYGHVEAR